MAHDPSEHPEREPDFARGEDVPGKHTEEERHGRFSEGEEELPEADREEQQHGRFSEGQEELPDERPREARGAALQRGSGRQAAGGQALGRRSVTRRVRATFELAPSTTIVTGSRTRASALLAERASRSVSVSSPGPVAVFEARATVDGVQ